MAPLVREAFELYATGNYSLVRLLSEMQSRGLRNRKGNEVSLNGISRILNNPFYTGVVRIRKTGEYFAGAHEPIVDRRTFDIVQAILNGKTVARTQKHEFPFARMVHCGLCGRTTMVELQKGHAYYRCHTRGCPIKTVRGEEIERALARAFIPLQLNDAEIEGARQWFSTKRENWKTAAQEQIEACNLQLTRIRVRLSRLTDAFLDGSIDKSILDERRAEMLFAQADAQKRLHDAQAGEDPELEKLERYLELVKDAQNLANRATPLEKRDLVKALTSNLRVTPESVDITLTPEAQLIANREKLPHSSPHKGVPRTWEVLFQQLSTEFKKDSESSRAVELMRGMEQGESFAA